MKGFIRRGQKTSPQKSEGIENASNSPGNRVGTSVASASLWKEFSVNLEFASPHLAKNTRRQQRRE